MSLARVACFSKEAIDLHLLESSISSQIHGNLIFFISTIPIDLCLRVANFVNIEFAITFFLTRLDHDGLYVMYEVGHLEFPSSLAQLPVFTNLKNLNTLLLVCHVFWKFCKKSDIPSIMQRRHRTSVKLTDLIDLTDPTKDRNRSCPVRF